MSDVDDVFAKTRTAAEGMRDVLLRDDCTPADVKQAAESFDSIEDELERLLRDG